MGWSDIYPAAYDRQWVNVSGLRGCFAFVMRVDPANLFFEENESNNRSWRIIRLPYRDRPSTADPAGPAPLLMGLKVNYVLTFRPIDVYRSLSTSSSPGLGRAPSRRTDHSPSAS